MLPALKDIFSWECIFQSDVHFGKLMQHCSSCWVLRLKPIYEKHSKTRELPRVLILQFFYNFVLKSYEKLS